MAETKEHYIITCLKKNGSLSPSDIMKETKKSQSTISHHLKNLVREGKIEPFKKPKVRGKYYRIRNGSDIVESTSNIEISKPIIEISKKVDNIDKTVELNNKIKKLVEENSLLQAEILKYRKVESEISKYRSEISNNIDNEKVISELQTDNQKLQTQLLDKKAQLERYKERLANQQNNSTNLDLIFDLIGNIDFKTYEENKKIIKTLTSAEQINLVKMVNDLKLPAKRIDIVDGEKRKVRDGRPVAAKRDDGICRSYHDFQLTRIKAAIQQRIQEIRRILE